MYEYWFQGSGVQQDPLSVTHHIGSFNDLLVRHEADVLRASADGLTGFRQLAPFLLQRIADARTLRTAWDWMATHGGSAPGPDGQRYKDFSSPEAWDLCRCLATAIKKGRYHPGPERVIHINKGKGKGQRILSLQDIADRVVQRAAHIILQPILERLFYAHSFGSRPGLSCHHALATAEHLALQEHRNYWVCDDIRDAFPSVPLPRLFNVIYKFLPDKKLLQFLETVLSAQKVPGLRQGGSLSGLLMNLYLHHCLDHPWHRHGTTPLLRVVDDLLVPCVNRSEGQDSNQRLRELLGPAGFQLKGNPATVFDLKTESVVWLGYSITAGKGRLSFGITATAWVDYENRLKHLHVKSQSSLRAYKMLPQWLGNRGPAFPFENRPEVCRQLIALAQRSAFEEVPSVRALLKGWRRAYMRWSKLRTQVSGTHSPPGLTDLGQQ